MSQVLNTLLDKKVVAIVRGIPSDAMAPLMEALIAGGIHCVEITFDHSGNTSLKETAQNIQQMKNRFGGKLQVGAGTVLTADEVKMAADAGASFVLSPNMRPAVIKATKAAGMVSIPGAFTPTEIEQAWLAGADIVKLFPADVAGPGYIKAVLGPLPHIRISAVGGVTLENITGFLDAGACSVGIGGNLVNKTRVEEKRFDEITRIACSYMEKIK